MAKQLFFRQGCQISWLAQWTLQPDHCHIQGMISKEHRTKVSPLLVTVVKDHQRCNTTLTASVHTEETSVATTRSLLNPSQGNQINTALFSAKPTSNIEAPCPVEMKGLENEGPSTSFVYVCIHNTQEPKRWYLYLKMLLLYFLLDWAGLKQKSRL